MKNLEQIRAAAALGPAQGLSREAINKLPGLIINNGLLAAAAFCQAGGDGNKDHLKEAMQATAQHLHERKILPRFVSIKEMIGDLCQKDASTLQRATAEALAFLAFLKRFAPKKSS
jgi:CRISPR/Cas system CMR-associated protein Cmr5 small subunit